jgi:hypothetical protein
VGGRVDVADEVLVDDSHARLLPSVSSSSFLRTCRGSRRGAAQRSSVVVHGRVVDRPVDDDVRQADPACPGSGLSPISWVQRSMNSFDTDRGRRGRYRWPRASRLHLRVRPARRPAERRCARPADPSRCFLEVDLQGAELGVVDLEPPPLIARPPSVGTSGSWPSTCAGRLDVEHAADELVVVPGVQCRWRRRWTGSAPVPATGSCRVDVWYAHSRSSSCGSTMLVLMSTGSGTGTGPRRPRPSSGGCRTGRWSR